MTDVVNLVKFSGGRSSGMMLMQLLEDGKLQGKRGDVVVFNNTTAEHPATYDFVARLKEITEQTYGVPFFILEFQTYEARSKLGRYVRRPTYRLATGAPHSQYARNGYRSNGEAFEELISWRLKVPDRFTRICTRYLKIWITHEFFANWITCGAGAPLLGPADGVSQISDADIIATHSAFGGKTPAPNLLAKKEYISECPPVRPFQLWKDYTAAPDHRPATAAKDYRSYLGIRADEMRRVVRIRENRQENECVSFPLVEAGITKPDVLKYWQAQPFDLDLPGEGHYSNCLFCFLKKPASLVALAADKRNASRLNWWERVERQYSRDRVAEGRKMHRQDARFQGFWGASSELIFPRIRARAARPILQEHDLFADGGSDSCYCHD